MRPYRRPGEHQAPTELLVVRAADLSRHRRARTRGVLAGRVPEAGELFAFHHDGFWKSMDTYKESLDLTELCREGSPPWLA